MKSATRRFRFSCGLVVACLIALSGCNANPRHSAPEQRTHPDSPIATDALRLSVLREAAIKFGLVRPAQLIVPGNLAREEIGGRLFASPLLSLNGSISCQDCHLDKFGSTDGLPNAVGAGGSGQGSARLHGGGQIIPRNVLPLWGVGGKGFETFFWDGRVSRVDGKIISQFGDMAPSDDPLVVAAHLPPAELREMIADVGNVRDQMAKEDVSIANEIYETIADRVRSNLQLGHQLAKAYGKPLQAISFEDIADALAQFIRHKFAIRQTKFHKFVFDGGTLTRAELNGGIIFYGRGRCVACHNGPYFSDFRFHAIAFPQVGFGKNGFGIDEGRYNTTLDPKDRFLFRTPPLYNLSKTAPYSHSGSVPTIEQAIVAHFDPLRIIDPHKMSVRGRADLFQRLGLAAQETLPSALTERDVQDLVAFLETLQF